MQDYEIDISAAYNAPTLEDFLIDALPWPAIRARILESGATFGEGPWCARWTPIPRTVKLDPDPLAVVIKSVFYRVHDCLHQLWGTPQPGYTEDDFYFWKRVSMCGEVAVLTLTEFVWGRALRQQAGGRIIDIINARNALPLWDGHPHLTVEQLAGRLDRLLHGGQRPKWVRNNPVATAFVDDYVPMLQTDRDNIDHNWPLVKHRTFDVAPSRAPRHLDGSELTLWMVRDFLRLCETSPVVDRGLMRFNRGRRATVELPDGWRS